MQWVLLFSTFIPLIIASSRDDITRYYDWRLFSAGSIPTGTYSCNTLCPDFFQTNCTSTTDTGDAVVSGLTAQSSENSDQVFDCDSTQNLNTNHKICCCSSAECNYRSPIYPEYDVILDDGPNPADNTYRYATYNAVTTIDNTYNATSSTFNWVGAERGFGGYSTLYRNNNFTHNITVSKAYPFPLINTTTCYSLQQYTYINGSALGTLNITIRIFETETILSLITQNQALPPPTINTYGFFDLYIVDLRTLSEPQVRIEVYVTPSIVNQNESFYVDAFRLYEIECPIITTIAAVTQAPTEVDPTQAPQTPKALSVVTEPPTIIGDKDKDTLSTGAIVGIVIGAVAVSGFITFGIVVWTTRFF